MARKDKEPQVRTTWDFLESALEPVVLAGGFALPRELNVDAEPTPGVTVKLHVVVDDEHARCDSVTLQTDQLNGIGLDVMRRVPIRNLMATALLAALHKVEFSADGSVRLNPVTARNADRSEEIRAAVQKLVGWVRA
jgi:hypothetical protein